MADVALVACAKTKASSSSTAAALYVSALYRKSLLAALDRAKSVYILSAKHGIVELGARLDPYEMTLKTMPAASRKAWGDRVSQKIVELTKPRDRLVLFAGSDYSRPIRDVLRLRGYLLEFPLGDRSLGERLSHLRKLNGETEIEAALPRFNKLLQRLSKLQQGGRRISECSGRQNWPERGLYFVTEMVGQKNKSTVTRVGTHAVSLGSRTTLWDRISTHRGTNNGGGSHRSSIFRAHVGRAFCRSEKATFVSVESWGVGQSAPAEVRANETHLERRVSEIIGAMRILWLDVLDIPGPRSDRAYLERNIIGLLSRTNLLGIKRAPAANWLGNESSDWRIAASGLWNLDHIFYRPDSKFLDVLEAYVQAMEPGGSAITRSIAPTGWGDTIPGQKDDQLSLFVGGEGGA